MAYWLAAEADTLRHDWIKRFDPRFWTVNFPRPMMAALTTPAPDALRVDLAFLKSNDLAGLIWESADRFDHPLLRYATARDYRGVQLGFRWQCAAGVMPLDAVNGPVLTIEGRDAAGNARAWYVRLWNYATGTPEDARIALDFDALAGGFLHPAEADPVWAGAIDRLFISLVPPAYDGLDAPLAAGVDAVVLISEIRCGGEGSTLAIGDTFVPPHSLRIASGYDDSYNLAPARLLRGMVQTGYHGVINHYVGMSHYPVLRWDAGEARFMADAATTINTPCRVWHQDFAARAARSGFDLILSLSYELLDQLAPAAWKQRDAAGNPALTGWSPPSTLLSPANAQAMAYLQAVAGDFVGIA
ncbi:MAG: non-contractile tail sheath protein, partial [Polymorphobacter sp.]